MKGSYHLKSSASSKDKEIEDIIHGLLATKYAEVYLSIIWKLSLESYDMYNPWFVNIKVVIYSYNYVWRNEMMLYAFQNAWYIWEPT